MGGDYTRVTHRPRQDYAGVHEQQGRVALDADFNELGDIVDRRARASMLDVMGRCAVPVSDPANASAFRITPTGPGAFTIGAGRMYVDGIAIECHGRPPWTHFDARLGEAHGNVATVDFSAPPPDGQPYFPAPLPPAASAPGVTDLAYVDVWRREVTAIEDPGLREVALGGPDTTTRWQTVWQVRLLQDVGAMACGDPLAAWDALVRPSAGRLTVRRAPTGPAPTPCVVETPDGYNGLENRLYRVEVHEEGALGAARFKWSRHNASLAAGVEAVAVAGPDTRLTVSTTGPDQVVRFAPGDWVELLDDHVEWRRESGHFARVTAVDPANRTVTIAGAIPPGFAFDPADRERHLRLRQWMTADVGAAGLATAAAGPIVLDPGVEIEFSLDATIGGGQLEVGDYWVFAARTIDGSVEELDQAPPRGIHHHFCRLALITWGATPAATRVEDCRPLWPAGDEGCCTEVVHPGESIQGAIDRLPAAGGCVCLKAGVHDITRPIRIMRSGVALHGESPGAIVRRRDGSEMLEVGDPSGAAIENVAVHDVRWQAGPSGRHVIAFASANDVAFHDCEIALLERASRTLVTGIATAKCDRVVVARSRIDGPLIGVATQGGADLTVDDCRMSAPTVDTAASPIDAGLIGVLAAGTFAPVRVSGNTIAHFAHGVVVGEGAAGAIVARNLVHRGAGVVTSTRDLIPRFMSGTVSPAARAMLGERSFGIVAAADGVIVADNRVRQADPRHGGILTFTGETRVDRNHVQSALPRPGGEQEAIAILVLQPDPKTDASGVLVRGNVVRGVQHGILAAGAPSLMRGLQVRENDVDSGLMGAVGALTGIMVVDVGDSAIVGNRVRQQATAIVAARGEALHVEANDVRGVNNGLVLASLRASHVGRNVVVEPRATGIAAVALTSCELADDVVEGSPEGPQLLVVLTGGTRNRLRGARTLRGMVGVLATAEEQLEVTDCDVVDARWLGIAVTRLAAARISRCRVHHCGYVPQPFSDAPVGMAILATTAAEVSVSDCDVRDSGRSLADDATPANVLGIATVWVAAVHLHGNVVRAPEGREALRHTGISISIAGDAEVNDNVVSATIGGRLLDVVPSHVTPRVILGSNRFAIDERPANPGFPPVRIRARGLSAVGNQVRWASDNDCVDLTGTPRLSAVGNMSSSNWTITAGTTTRPQPFTDFNVINFTF